MACNPSIIATSHNSPTGGYRIEAIVNGIETSLLLDTGAAVSLIREDTWLRGHLGEENTFCRLRERYYWPGYYSDVQHWCRTCASCAARKPSSPKNHASLQNNIIKVGEPYKEGNLVWLHTGVSQQKGKARKFHRSWTGPYRVVQKFSDVTYRLQDIQAPCCRPIVHSDRLKLCPKDMRLPHLQCNDHQPCRTQVHGNRSPPGTYLTIVEQSDSPVPVEQSETSNKESSSQGQQTRYPSRSRQQPDWLLPMVRH